MERGEDVRALAEVARQCAALRGAVVLADWVGTGRQVTAKGVLRRVDVPSAGSALGVEVPRWVRSAADLPALHRPWAAAAAVGLLLIRDGRVVPGPAVADWCSTADETVLECWSRALAAVLADTFPDDGDGSEALEIGRLALNASATDPGLTLADLSHAISRAVIATGSSLYRTFDRSFGTRDPAEVALELLTAFGAMTVVGGCWQVTPIGHWALPVLEARGASLLGSSVADADADAVQRLKITLRYVRPACWRRVLVSASATLGDLHEIIQIAFAWDDDHLHGFTVGRRQYGDPCFDFEHDEDKITLAKVFAQARKPISYVYDFGDMWRHEIVLEKTTPPDPAAVYPVCVEGRGDSPVEDSGEDEPAWNPFDREGVNAKLGRLAGDVRQVGARLRDDIEIILTDAYGEAEESTAFQTVLESELDFPVPAILLGEPVVVTGLTEDQFTLELRARCRGKSAAGLVSFADLEFRPGTVEAWLHAAYLCVLGRPYPTPTPPAGWDGLDHWRS